MNLKQRFDSAGGWLHAATILIGAFLVFQVQPIISKTILPWFGGSPAVWTTCMLFFQVLLFVGYGYAHLLAQLRPTKQAVIHVAIISLSLPFLPIIPDVTWKTQSLENPTATILLLLAATVGLPYFLLSSTGPLVQSWFSRSFPGKSPYRLYALSNIGSLAALLTYPFLVEPRLTVRGQAVLWSTAFALFGVCCVVLACMLRRTETTDRKGEPTTNEKNVNSASSAGPSAPGVSDCLVWLSLTALASMMLLATTNHVCQDVAVIPFLWVAPLSLYLVSFIVCFDKDSWYKPKWFGFIGMLAITAISLTNLIGHLPSLLVEICLYFTALFCICMVCHGELVRRKPGASHLTLFYLISSAGGALGGVFVALVCPHVFDGFVEMHLGLILS